MNTDVDNQSWIVRVWAAVFGFLGRLSVFALLRRVFPVAASSYRFAEYYVATHTAMSIFALAIVTYRRDHGDTLLLLAVMIYGVLRSIEIFVYQVNVLLFDEYRARRAGRKYAVKGYRRTAILLLHNYLEIVCWFGVTYMWFYRSGTITLPDDSPDPTFLRVFYESLLVMFSFSPGVSRAATDTGLAVFSVQAIVGMFMTLVVLARFIGVLPPPQTMDELEKDQRDVGRNDESDRASPLSGPPRSVDRS